ncbi:unnamed protein product [Pedinophyceae sp. YPF-701]|nr:unnamed protein product [Pedinophyceae sp. YPF-701]
MAQYAARDADAQRRARQMHTGDLLLGNPALLSRVVARTSDLATGQDLAELALMSRGACQAVLASTGPRPDNMPAQLSGKLLRAVWYVPLTDAHCPDASPRLPANAQLRAHLNFRSTLPEGPCRNPWVLQHLTKLHLSAAPEVAAAPEAAAAEEQRARPPDALLSRLEREGWHAQRLTDLHLWGWCPWLNDRIAPVAAGLRELCLSGPSSPAPHVSAPGTSGLTAARLVALLRGCKDSLRHLDFGYAMLPADGELFTQALTEVRGLETLKLRVAWSWVPKSFVERLATAVPGLSCLSVSTEFAEALLPSTCLSDLPLLKSLRTLRLKHVLQGRVAPLPPALQKLDLLEIDPGNEVFLRHCFNLTVRERCMERAGQDWSIGSQQLKELARVQHVHVCTLQHVAGPEMVRAAAASPDGQWLPAGLRKLRIIHARSCLGGLVALGSLTSLTDVHLCGRGKQFEPLAAMPHASAATLLSLPALRRLACLEILLPVSALPSPGADASSAGLRLRSLTVAGLIWPQHGAGADADSGFTADRGSDAAWEQVLFALFAAAPHLAYLQVHDSGVWTCDAGTGGGLGRGPDEAEPLACAQPLGKVTRRRGAGMGSAALCVLAHAPTLRRIDIGSAHIDEGGFSALAAGARALKGVNLHSATMETTPAVCGAVARLAPRLHTLWIDATQERRGARAWAAGTPGRGEGGAWKREHHAELSAFMSAMSQLKKSIAQLHGRENACFMVQCRRPEQELDGFDADGGGVRGGLGEESSDAASDSEDDVAGDGHAGGAASSVSDASDSASESEGLSGELGGGPCGLW